MPFVFVGCREVGNGRCSIAEASYQLQSIGPPELRHFGEAEPASLTALPRKRLPTSDLQRAVQYDGTQISVSITDTAVSCYRVF